MPRVALPVNDESGAIIRNKYPNVKPTDMRRKLPIYPNIVTRGGAVWNFSGIQNRALYPSPHGSSWERGRVPRPTREAMLRHHKIYQGINNLIDSINGDATTIPPISPYGPDRANFELAWEISQFCDWALRNMTPTDTLNGSIYDVNRQMLECVYDGNRLAPIVMKDQQTGKYKGWRVLDTLTVWPNGTYQYYQNAAGDITAINCAPGLPISEDSLLDRRKFYVLRWRPTRNDPHGTSLCDPSYLAYYKDIMADVEESAFLAQVGRPSVIVFASPPPEYGEEMPQPLFYADGSPVMEEDPENPGELRHREGYETEQNSILFTALEAGSVWSMEHGSLVEKLEANANGADVFRYIRAENARNITGVILGTHQVSENEKSMGQGNSEAGENLMGVNVTYGRTILEIAEERQLLWHLVYQNFGAAGLDYLPIRNYGSGNNARIPRIINSIQGIINGGNFTEDQWWWICVQMRWPLPFPDGTPIRVRIQEATEKLKARQQTMQAPGGADKSGGGNPPSNPGNGDNSQNG